MPTSSKICQAAFDGDIDTVAKLLLLGADINGSCNSWNPLHGAIENQQLDVIRLLIDKGADLEFINSGMTPLAHAVESECDGLLQTGGDLDSPDFDLIEVLLDAGCDIDPGIAEAASNGNMAMLRWLLRHKK